MCATSSLTLPTGPPHRSASQLGSTIAATLKYDLRLSAGISVDALLNAKLIPGLSTIGSEIIVPKSTVVGGLTS